MSHLSLKNRCALALGRCARFLLRHVFRRPAAQLPGKIALSVSKTFVSDMAGLLGRRVYVVTGTNGKTTTTNLVYETLRKHGERVICNTQGANMMEGVATCLLDAPNANMAVIELDELTCKYALPALKPKALLLLNLFRDQLDRAGEIDHVKEVLANTLHALVKEDMCVVVNADDPISYATALDASPKHLVSFGLTKMEEEELDRVPEARFCQVCGHELSYAWRSYAQLGAYSCEECGFSRPAPNVVATDITLQKEGFSCEVIWDGSSTHLTVPFGGLYMIYNVVGAYALSCIAGASQQDFTSCVAAYSPQNGRLQHFEIASHLVTLNLAKNPTGFNQNISFMERDTGEKIVYVVINDNVNDGRDISWIYDVDFELLENKNCHVYVGGSRAFDVAVRMKYAGVFAEVADSIDDVLAQEQNGLPLYVLCNYSALAPQKAKLETLANKRR